MLTRLEHCTKGAGSRPNPAGLSLLAISGLCYSMAEMRELLLDAIDDHNEPLQVEEEPALEIALPQVFTQPRLTHLRRHKLANLEWIVAKLYRRHVDEQAAPETIARLNGRAVVLGPGYQDVVNEFQPLFDWSIASWDYLLSTEGCRFLPRCGEEKRYARGEYRAATVRDYSRLSHRVFRQCLLDYACSAGLHSLTGYLRAHFWEAVVLAYRRLEDPPDPRQRKLTAYSYLRCSPYRFLNAFHHELVYDTVGTLSGHAYRAIERYFLSFHTLPATAEVIGLPLEACEELLRQAAADLLIHHRLVYCLLRQIERY